MNTMAHENDWATLKRFLPAGWKDEAYALKALQRTRKIKDPETLLRLLLMHLADGTSMRTTVACAQETGLCEINDVALLHRLKVSGRWLRWIAHELVEGLRKRDGEAEQQPKFRVRVVDGTVVSEPGATGTDWRLHYSLELETLRCDSFLVTTAKEGETLQRFKVQAGDLLLADRGYCGRNGIVHVVASDGHVIVRYHSTNLPLHNRRGRRWDPLKHLRKLAAGKVGDWDVWLRHPDTGHLLKGRLCAVRKSAEAAAKARHKVRRKASKERNVLKKETLEHAGYVTVFTTVNRHALSGGKVLSLYRDRWQVELVFKRLKGLVKLGALPKTEGESCKAWLHGKLVIALLAEHLHREAEFFSPWGYPLCSGVRAAS
jgi:hypothetical protein